MSQNKSDHETKTATGNAGHSSPTGSTGGSASTGSAASTSATDTGIARTSGAATGTATGLADQAKEYGQKVADAATQAKDYITDKASVVGDKFQDLRNADYAQVMEDTKQYARQNPGQALVVAAAAGFVLGLLLRGGRRS